VLLAWFAREAPIKLEHVPYRGAGQAINEVLASLVQVAFLGPTALLPQYEGGKLRLLAQSGEVRSRSLPEVPTLHESGFPGMTLESWYAGFVPVGTPHRLSGASRPPDNSFSRSGRRDARELRRRKNLVPFRRS
jgi:tripartite-type tricarboxylate transporter receptor subunit TctC